MDVRQRIAENIKYYRKEKKIGQKEIATHFGVRESTVSMWECGRNMISADMFFELADLLGVSADDLAGRNQEYSREERALIASYRQLDHNHKAIVRATLDAVFNAREAS